MSVGASFVARVASLLGCLALGCMPGCAGRSDTTAEQPGTATGSGGTGAPGSCSDPKPECVPSWCGGDVVYPAICQSGVWTCGDGLVPRDQCPPDACFSAPVLGCCDAAGVQHAPICPNRGAMVCPAGTTAISLLKGEQCAQPAPCELDGCESSQLCRFDDGSCGKGAPGHCVERPVSCPSGGTPICGCDGKVHESECSAAQAGVGPGMLCSPLAGYSTCAWAFCALGSEYCEVTPIGGGYVPVCRPLPASCGSTPSCACLDDEPCADQCSDAGNGWLKLSCIK